MALKSLFSFSLAWLIYAHSFGQQTAPTVTLSNPAGMARPTGYSHLAEVDVGSAKMVFIAGQVAMDGAGNVVGKDDPKAQFEQIFRNIQTLVKAAGGNMGNVIKLTIYFRNMTHLQLFRDVRDQFIDRQHPPTSTAVEVSHLFRDDFLAEVEAVAVIPKPK